MPIAINGSGTITGISAGGLPDACITAAELDGAQSGSAPIYAARAWVNFNGTSTVAIRASGNVSSITDNGTGDYTVNFTTAMADANYAVAGAGEHGSLSTNDMRVIVVQTRASGNVRIATTYGNGVGGVDLLGVHVAIFR
jgi:hypothetical protein